MARDVLNFDYETASEVDLRKVGLDVYSAHSSTRVLMCSYSLNGSPVRLWDTSETRTMPGELREAIESPEVEKAAFNAQFERVISRRVLGLKPRIEDFRCTMAMAYLQSFTGPLDEVGMQVGLPIEKQKLKEGRSLIRLFCGPQRVTRNQPFRWRTYLTDPDKWAVFRDYCVQDTVAEMAIRKRLLPFDVTAGEWDLYHLDQQINDRGLPIDTRFVDNAIRMVARRKDELKKQLQGMTGLDNPASRNQMLPWLLDRGYPFGDLRADTVKKVLAEFGDQMADEAVTALKLRKELTRTSVSKYDSLRDAVGADGRMRFTLQFAGASRTGRWSGRRFQPTNLPRTPKLLEAEDDPANLTVATNLIRADNYAGLELFVGDPMVALVGALRSSIRAPEGYELRVCDLSSIESCVIAWLSGCKRLLQVFADGKDPYKDFATVLYKILYEEVTKHQRTNSKPAVLGAGYRLGGGELREGRRTGLWGYAENMGINLTQREAIDAVRLFRETYHEIPQLWYALENAVERCVKSGRPDRVGPLRFELKRPYLVVWLPSGRPMYYYRPRMVMETRLSRDGEPYQKRVFTYDGSEQNTNRWTRISSHGGKLVENFVQAIARDVLVAGMRRAQKDGFKIDFHVYDEIVALQRSDDTYHTQERLGQLMTAPLPWAPGLPLGFDGWSGPFYRK